MSLNIYASFENRDAAERAAARLRKKGIAFRFDLQDDWRRAASDFKAAHASISLLFPYHPPYASNEFSVSPTHWDIGKAELTSDTMGIPLYPGSGTAHAKITVGDEHLEAARSILRSCGAYDMH